MFFGNNLDILRDKFPNECIDLIYLDPPFNSKKDYNILFKEKLVESEAQLTAFEDSWHWTMEAEKIFEELVTGKSRTKISAEISNLIQGFEKILGRNDVMAYLVMMTIRLIELHRVLKKKGSLYLHCDPTASHYLKIILDVIFDKNNFKREIIWSVETVSGFKSQAKNWIRGHDTILFYTKSSDYYFKKEFLEHKPEYLARFKKVDETGRKYRDDRSGGRKQYLDETEGRMIGDVWNDIMSFQQASTSSERLGYETQKPKALLKRIIEASSNKGDMVLDPFCGCGTTIAAAEELERQWVGIDITTLAINIMKHRMEKQFNFSKKKIKINLEGIPKDLSGAQELALKNRFEFEYWALSLVNAMPKRSKEKMYGADKGIDGIIVINISEKEFKKLLVQVKSGKVQRSDVATLKGDVEREQAIGGVLITLEEPTAPMKEEAVKSGFFEVLKQDYPKVQIITIKELFEGKKLNLPNYSGIYKDAKETKILSSEKQKKLIP